MQRHEHSNIRLRLATIFIKFLNVVIEPRGNFQLKRNCSSIQCKEKMPSTGTFSLTICFAVLLTVRALQCYNKIEYDCSPSGPVCDAFPQTSMTVTECDSDVTMCGLINIGATAEDYKLHTSIASCLPQEDGVSLTSGCYGREDLEKIYPDKGKELNQLERVYRVTLDPVEICICDGNLCNGSIKSVSSISIIITSVVISFMLFN
ncbi:hypothetical protein HOLleu_22920 [Holothuria leucospilota]|uniref:Protein quiver n=1 Tax=Holothuria leucospilota TaxID=206669 RepID=A0A9Q1BUJ2_HOLLE|nr:hypothetical protein HOLleu_22920 [Holothuria leucospilota]